LVQSIRPGTCPLDGGIRKVQQGLLHQLGSAGVGVPEKQNQHSYPTEFLGFDSDYRNGLAHQCWRSTLFSTPVRDSSADGILPAHDFGAANDKNLVSSFLRDAEEIFAAARAGGPEDCDLAILVSREGGIHMVAGSDWGLEPLRMRHGATTAYRIARTGGRLRLEARSAHESCVLRTDQRERPLAAIPDFPRYRTLG
jgi:hypothetical protein